MSNMIPGDLIQSEFTDHLFIFLGYDNDNIFHDSLYCYIDVWSCSKEDIIKFAYARSMNNNGWICVSKIRDSREE